MGVRLTMAGMGLVLAVTAGCGQGATAGEATSSDGQGAEDAAASGTTVLPDLTGQQVCDLLSPETLAKYAPGAETANNTVASTETRKQALCDSTALQGGASSRFLTIEVTSALNTAVDGTPVEGATAEEAITDWLDSQRSAAEGPADLEGVGDEAFTAFAHYPDDGRTDSWAVLRSGIWGVKVNYHGADRPNPDDRDNKVYLPKEVLVPAVTEIVTEIEGNLAGLTGGVDTPADPGELSGDMVCTLLSDEVVTRYLPGPETNARTGKVTDAGASATCDWRSAEPRPDSPGLRIRSAGVVVRVSNLDVPGTFEDEKRDAQREHDDGPDQDGAAKGSTFEAPRDVPDLGLAAYLVIGRSAPDSQYPTTTATISVLLPGNRIVDVSYGGTDAAELDTGDGDTDLGEARSITDEEAIAGATAMAGEVLTGLG